MRALFFCIDGAQSEECGHVVLQVLLEVEAEAEVAGSEGDVTAGGAGTKNLGLRDVVRLHRGFDICFFHLILTII